jgi:flagellin
VYAKVDTNVVSGTGGMTATALTGTITINGVTTDSFSTSAASTSLSRKQTVVAINAKSEQTGVVAIDTEDDTLGVTLQAADGRNIDIAFNTLTAATTGVRDTGTFVGSYNLFTLDSRAIDVSFQTGDQNVEAFSGLRNGSYASDTALYNTYKRATAAEATAPSDTTTGTLSNDSLMINGVAIGQALATDDTASDTTSASSTREASAIAISAAINRKTDLTGVTASASPNVIRGEGFTAGTSADVYLNGVTFTANAVTRNAVIDSFNDVSDRTGVVASAWGEGIELRAVDGRNISIGSATAANIGLTGIGIGSAAGSATAVTYYSQVTMQSDNKFTVKSGNAGIPNLELLGFRQGTFGGADNGLKINQVDVSTVSGANQAIVAIDAAIETISKSQANSGALNNRMDYIVANLSEASQNMSASRSRILDTDYASETTSLAKQQIISQAATAMLAQANQQPQSVLSLLK